MHLEINESQPLLRARISLTLPPEDLPKSCPVSVRGAFCFSEGKLRGGPFCKKGLPAPLPKNSHIMLTVHVPPPAEHAQRVISSFLKG